MDRKIKKWCSYNFAAGGFHTKKLCSRLFSTVVEIYWIIAKSRFVPPFGALRGNVHVSSMARVVDFLLVLIELFLLALTVEALWADTGQNIGDRKGGGPQWAQISGRRGSSTNDSWRQKTRFPGLSRSVVCVILRLSFWYNTGVW